VDDLALFADHSEPLQQALTVLREDLAGLRLRVHAQKTRLLRTASGVMPRPASPPRAGTPTWPMATPFGCAVVCFRPTPSATAWPRHRP
jgi:hypothetical protein